MDSGAAGTGQKSAPYLTGTGAQSGDGTGMKGNGAADALSAAAANGAAAAATAKGVTDGSTKRARGVDLE